MSVQTYNYKAKWNFTATVQIASGIGGTDAARGQNVALAMQGIMQQQALAEFTNAMMQAGHWLKVNSIVCTCTATDAHFVVPWTVLWTGSWWQSEITGSMVVDFDTDVKDPLAHNSPMLQEVVWAFVSEILATLAAHPNILTALAVGAGVLIVGLIAWAVANILLSQGTQTVIQAVQTAAKSLTDVGSNVGATAIVLGVVGLTALGIFALFFTSRGKKVQSRAKGVYQRARRRR